ncbi:hypothetical protein J6590_003768 [Homalodisca vitripennis]|nr:hypothetical protein J6590_003768 [Homalodisca vitripennis]
MASELPAWFPNVLSLCRMAVTGCLTPNGSMVRYSRLSHLVRIKTFRKLEDHCPPLVIESPIGPEGHTDASGIGRSKKIRLKTLKPRAVTELVID